MSRSRTGRNIFLPAVSQYRETEELTRRHAADHASVAYVKIGGLTPRQLGKNLLPFLLRRISGMRNCGKISQHLPLQKRQELTLREKLGADSAASHPAELSRIDAGMKNSGQILLLLALQN